MHVNVEGASDLINRISRFDKDVYKVLQKSIRDVTTEVKRDAESMEPVGKALFGTMGGDVVSEGWGGWTATRDGRDLSFDGSEVGLRGGMKVQVRKTTHTTTAGKAYGIVGKVVAPNNPAAAIFLLAGSKNPDRKKGWGGNFNAELNRRFGTTFPRGLTTAWRRGYAGASARIDAAVEAARAAIVG
jgi:hypothetical protein